jgi:hypothetical protein
VPADLVYILQFEWPEGVDGEMRPECELDADSEAQARFQAALLYAGAAFDEPAPLAYRIVGPGGGTVYRYPELTDPDDAPRPWPIDVPLPGRA